MSHPRRPMQGPIHGSTQLRGRQGRVARFVVVVGTLGLFAGLSLSLAGCPDDPLGDLKAPVLLGTDGRVRYVVTLDAPAVDLAEYRGLLKDNPGGVSNYVARKRADATAAFAGVDGAVASLGGRIVERWWMSNQATIEIPATGLATIKGVAGVKSVEPDRPLQ